jgi:hypothetical protein
MWHSIYEELKTWQQGVGALIGFVALMGAAWWNFHLNRRRDAALRNEEARAILAALYGEIVVLYVNKRRFGPVFVGVPSPRCRGL